MSAWLIVYVVLTAVFAFVCLAWAMADMADRRMLARLVIFAPGWPLLALYGLYRLVVWLWRTADLTPTREDAGRD